MNPSNTSTEQDVSEAQFTTASPGFLSKLNSNRHENGAQGTSSSSGPNAVPSTSTPITNLEKPHGSLEKLMQDVPDSANVAPVVTADMTSQSEKAEEESSADESTKKEKKEKKKKVKKVKNGQRVLVFTPENGYHYAVIAGSEENSTGEKAEEGDPEKTAKKEAKREAKRLRKEQKKMAEAAALGLDAVPLSSMQEQSEAFRKEGSLSKLPLTFNRQLLPGQVEITSKNKRRSNDIYERELANLQIELVKLQAWIKVKGLKVVVIFEGRDAAGKGGVIKRITERLNPRICRVCALGTPTERERTQWYFQRYVNQLPAAGEMVLFDRSWYTRGGVEKVMGFCSDDEYTEFMSSCPIFEEMLIRSGIILVKYWFSVSDDVQEKRFQGRIADSTKRWKLSPMDVASRDRWVEYSKAKDEMLKYTDTDNAPWIHVHADSKKLARLNCISHLLSCIPYQDLTPPPTILPPRKHCQDYVRPPMTAMKWVPEKYV